MKLADALEVGAGDVVAFVGAGGKTSAMFRLAGELTGRGLQVATTTTTRIAAEELRYAPQHIGMPPGINLPTFFDDYIQSSRHMFIYGRLTTPGGKVIGLPPEQAGDLITRQSVDVVIIEADGSRRLPLKGPFAHEPVIPGSTSLVVIVAGLDALDQPLDDAHVYGGENIVTHSGHRMGASITPDLIGRVVSHPALGLKSIPETARIGVLLNKADAGNLPAARSIANHVLDESRIERVLIGAVQEQPPIHEVQRRVGVIILAAGQSSRMGEPKVLLPWGDSTIIQQVAKTVTNTIKREAIIIAGQWTEDIKEQMAGLPVQIVQNPVYREKEMLSSLKVGLNALPDTTAAALVVLGDQPDVQTATIEAILDAYAQTQIPIVAPTYKGKRGHPVLFDRSLWPELLALSEGKAPRHLLQAHSQDIHHIEVDTSTILQDIDTPEDYARQRPD